MLSSHFADNSYAAADGDGPWSQLVKESEGFKEAEEDGYSYKLAWTSCHIEQLETDSR